MTVSQTARVARNLLKVIKESHLDSVEALRKIVGKQIDPEADDKYHGEEYVEVSVQPSNRGTQAVVLRYFRRVGQCPLEVRINESLGYSKILITCEKKINGYDEFDENEEGDHFQDKKLMTKDFTEVIKELEKIGKLA